MKALVMSPNGVRKPSLSTIMDEWFGNESRTMWEHNTPATNLIEHDDYFTMELSVPGRQKKDFSIQIDKNQLRVSSHFGEKEIDPRGEYHLKEIPNSNFSKSFNLSDIIDSDKISASCKDGILSIHLPKIEEAKKQPPRNITIK